MTPCLQATIPVTKRRESFPAAPDMSSTFQSDSQEEEPLKNCRVTVFDLPSPHFHVCFLAAGTSPGGQAFIKHSMAAPQTSSTTEIVEPFTLQKIEIKKNPTSFSAPPVRHIVLERGQTPKKRAFSQSAAVWLTVHQLKMVL